MILGKVFKMPSDRKRRSALVMAIFLLMKKWYITTGNGGSRLNSVLSQCTRGKSILLETRMAIPKLIVKPLQTCNPPNFKVYSSKLTNENFSHME